MPLVRSNAESNDLRLKPAGFTLVELMITITVMGVLIGMSLPRFGTAIEQSRADFAVANLRGIWAAQRLHWLENHAYAADLPTLQTLKLLDPLLSAETPTEKYTYHISGNSAEARRDTGSSWEGSFTIDEEGKVEGAISAPGELTIGPGF